MKFLYIKLVNNETKKIYFEKYLFIETNICEYLKNINISDEKENHCAKIINNIEGNPFSEPEYFTILNEESEIMSMIIYCKEVNELNNLYIIKQEEYLNINEINEETNVIPKIVKLVRLDNKLTGNEILQLLNNENINSYIKQYLQINRIKYYPDFNDYNEIKYLSVGSGYTQNTVYTKNFAIVHKFREYCTYHGEEGEYERYNYLTINKIDNNL